MLLSKVNCWTWLTWSTCTLGGSDNECGSELLGVTSNKQELPSICPQADTAPSGNGTIEPGNEPDNLIHFRFQSTRKPGYMHKANCFNLMMCATLLSAQVLLCTWTCVHVLWLVLCSACMFTHRVYSQACSMTAHWCTGQSFLVNGSVYVMFSMWSPLSNVHI